MTNQFEVSIKSKQYVMNNPMFLLTRKKTTLKLHPYFPNLHSKSETWQILQNLHLSSDVLAIFIAEFQLED